ncbi:DUF3300 domain-containing protein [Alteromonas sediminis]|uniref:DUF3300 domain-containing protein n=1 Tax=Alteromonas sediminis TaxID=2259342 RepID=A0A3N5Y9M8_9ALTE|nr:DUF3300 domain-containing protein [Alteromonas sediminis]RPJ65365.1 DUF3300 domain-containing protein [Alteromonas sediminis]
MRLITFAFLLIVGSASAHPHHNPKPNRYSHHQGLEHQIMIAYAYPGQLEAAIRWRLRHPYADVSLHLRHFHHQGWHPSVIALLHHPRFLDDLYHNPRWSLHYWDRPWYKNHHKRYSGHHKKHHNHYKPWKKKRHKHKERKRAYVREKY